MGRAVPIAPIQQPDNMAVNVRELCDAGFTEFVVVSACARMPPARSAGP